MLKIDMIQLEAEVFSGQLYYRILQETTGCPLLQMDLPGEWYADMYAFITHLTSI